MNIRNGHVAIGAAIRGMKKVVIAEALHSRVQEVIVVPSTFQHISCEYSHHQRCCDTGTNYLYTAFTVSAARGLPLLISVHGDLPLHGP